MNVRKKSKSKLIKSPLKRARALHLISVSISPFMCANEADKSPL